MIILKEKIEGLNTTRDWFLSQANYFSDLQKKYKWSREKLSKKVTKLGKYFYDLADSLSSIPSYKDFIAYVNKIDKKILTEAYNDEDNLCAYIYWGNVTVMESFLDEK